MKAIAAMSLNRVIGNNGQIPWNIPDDLQWFRKATTNEIDGGYILMGNETFKSVGTLPKRFIYVLTNKHYLRSLPPTKTHRYVDYDEFTWLMKYPYKIWLCGGAKVYQQFLPLCTEVYLTIVLDEYEGDTYMPPFEHMFPHSEIIRETKTNWIVKYWK